MVKILDTIKKVPVVVVEDIIKQKKLDLLLIIISILGLFFKFFYREIIYKFNIFDFYIADSSPNFFFSMFVPCILVKIKFNSDKPINIKSLTFFSMLGILMYEIEQNFSNMTFDYNDILATLLGSIGIYFILKKIIKIK